MATVISVKKPEAVQKAIKLFLPVLFVRTVLEERMLRQELPGYEDYIKQVKYHLVPYIW